MASDASQSGFLRHIRACQNAHLPGDRVPFRLGDVPVGWLRASLVAALRGFPAMQVTTDAVVLEDAAALPGIARSLADQGHYRLRAEEFDVRARPEGPVLARIDRGAIPSFGLLSVGVHVNGRVRRPDGLHLWVGRRAAHKALDPNKLDHLVAGGVPAGLTSEQTLLKEAAEEASLPAELARQARLAGRIGYTMERGEGLRRDHLLCFDLDVPESFRPQPGDDEVAVFDLCPVQRVLQTVRDTDDFKFNVNLVLIDLFLREGLIGGQEAAELRAALDQGSV